MWSVVVYHGAIHAVNPVSGVGACGFRFIDWGGDVVAREVPTVWAYRLIGSEGFGLDPYGEVKSADGVAHCVDCVVILSDLIEKGGA